MADFCGYLGLKHGSCSSSLQPTSSTAQSISLLYMWFADIKHLSRSWDLADIYNVVSLEGGNCFGEVHFIYKAEPRNGLFQSNLVPILTFNPVSYWSLIVLFSRSSEWLVWLLEGALAALVFLGCERSVVLHQISPVTSVLTFWYTVGLVPPSALFFFVCLCFFLVILFILWFLFTFIYFSGKCILFFSDLLKSC